MAINIPGVSCTMTKLADANIQIVLTNPNGGVRFAYVCTAAQFTAWNTTVNGGATGAAITVTNAQDLFASDYPVEYVGS